MNMNNYVKISITGRNPKLYLKRRILNKVWYSNYKELSYNKIELKLKYEDYLNFFNKSSIYQIKIEKLYGPIKYEKMIKENFTFLISFILGLLLLFTLSNTIFEIDIIHNDEKIRNLVKLELEENNISKFRFVPTFSKRTKIIEKILSKNKNDLEWLEIERQGSRLIVKVTERKENEEQESNEPRHIVAKKSGIIMKIEASEGEILKKKNDYVYEGETIISGDIIKDDTVKGQVRATGKVYAETWYLVNVKYPLYYKQTIYLDEVKNNVIINFLNEKFSLRKNYADMHLDNKITLVESKIFPFSINIEKQRKTKVKNEKYSIKQATEKAEELALKKIKSKLNDDEYIISKKSLNFTSNNSTIELDVFFKVYEDITDYKEVDKSLLNKKEE